MYVYELGDKKGFIQGDPLIKWGHLTIFSNWDDGKRFFLLKMDGIERYQ